MSIAKKLFKKLYQIAISNLILTQSGKKNLHRFKLLILENSTKNTIMSQVYETMWKWSHYNPIYTKTYCKIFKAFLSFEGFQK